jgi:ammonia channel protein AmtB
MSGVNGADTVFVIMSTVLVMIMTPGLALFYGGMVRGKNTLNSTLHSYSALANSIYSVDTYMVYAMFWKGYRRINRWS